MTKDTKGTKSLGMQFLEGMFGVMFGTDTNHHIVTYSKVHISTMSIDRNFIFFSAYSNFSPNVSMNVTDVLGKGSSILGRVSVQKKWNKINRLSRVKTKDNYKTAFASRLIQ